MTAEDAAALLVLITGKWSVKSFRWTDGHRFADVAIPDVAPLFDVVLEFIRSAQNAAAINSSRYLITTDEHPVLDRDGYVVWRGEVGVYDDTTPSSTRTPMPVRAGRIRVGYRPEVTP